MNWHQHFRRTTLAMAAAAGAWALLVTPTLAVVYFEDDFNSYNNADDTEVEAAGWVRTNTSDVIGANFNEILSLWTITNFKGRGNPASMDGSPTTGNFMVADSDGADSEDNPSQHTTYALTSPDIVTGLTPTLHFNVSASLNNNGYTGFFVESSSDGGTTWDRLHTSLGPGRLAGNPRDNGDGLGWEVDDEFVDNTTAGGVRGRLDLELPVSAANNNNVKVRFVEYEPNDDWWIAIDDVKVDDVPRKTSGSTVVFSEDFNAQDGTVGGMSVIAVTTSAFAGGTEQWAALDQPDQILGAPIYVPGTIQLNSTFEGRAVNRLGHPTAAGSSSEVPFAISAGFLATAGFLGGSDSFESILHTPVLDLSSMAEVILEFDSEGYTSSGKARVVLKETGGDGIDAGDAVVALIYDDNGINPTAGPGADHDLSGLVTGNDFLIQQRGFGSGTTHAEGDTDGNGAVDGADIAVFQTQFGAAPAAVGKEGGLATGEEPAFAERIFSVPEAVGRDDVYFAFEYGADSSSPLFGEGFWAAIDNVKVSGNLAAATAAVPEPGALALAMLGCLALRGIRGRRN